MKLFLKRGTDEGEGFTIYNTHAEPVCAAEMNFSSSIHIELRNEDRVLLSSIKFNRLMLDYFTIRCDHRFYVLIPIIGNHFSFAIYGSTFRFAGNLADGCFSMFNAKGEIIMTQKKCWAQHGDGYELEIKDEKYRLLMVSTAICADLFIALSEPRTAYSC